MNPIAKNLINKMLNIVLYQPEKPSNTGNIMRTCVAIGATLHIIGPITFSLDTKDLKRAGMDYMDNVKMFYYKDYQEYQKAHGNKLTYYITRYSKKVYSSVDFSDVTKDYYLMFGKESTGIPHDILRANEDKILRIPMVFNARSLNLSNSVAIICYEILRQQNFYHLATSEVIKGEDILQVETKK